MLTGPYIQQFLSHIIIYKYVWICMYEREGVCVFYTYVGIRLQCRGFSSEKNFSFIQVKYYKIYLTYW